MKLLPACILFAAALYPLAPAHALPPGCSEAAESVEAYVARAKEARERKAYGQAADELWSAWCRSSQFTHLVGVCEAHVLGKDPAKARELLAYAKRRMNGQSAADRDAILLCERQLEGAVTTTRPQQQVVEEDTALVTVVTDPPEAKVYLDNQLYGVLGTPVTFRAPKGWHVLRIQRPGYRPRTVRVSIGSEPVLTYTLTPEG